MVAAVVAGMGIEIFGLGWNLAMQENVPDEMLSRAYSYDMLGSFVAIPVGQLAFGPLADVFGTQDVLLVGGVVYVADRAADADLPLGARPCRGSAPLLSQRPDHRQVAVGRDPELLLDDGVGQLGLVVVVAEQQVHGTAADLGDLVGRAHLLEPS